MPRVPVWAVVPVKPFDAAKARLASILDAGERAQLARLMFEDVLAALAAGRHLLAGLIVSTADTEAAAIARSHGADVVSERDPEGLNAAIALAVEAIEERDASDTGDDAGLLVVPADLPHLRFDVLAKVVALLEPPPAVAMVEAPGDGGTNLFACRPARAVPPLFGPQSFWRHREAARHAGIRTAIVKSPELGLDIDRPDDLEAFVAMGTSTRTHAFLSGLDLPSRAAGERQFLSRGINSRAMVSI